MTRSDRRDDVRAILARTAWSFDLRAIPIGVQMLFVAFGALVLVPILTGLDPNVALFTAGAGTLVFQLVTRGKVPVFLASSFAFIAPIQVGVQRWGVSATLSGLVAAGLLYVALAALIRARGIEAFERLLPPVVTGPVIMVIGLSLAPVAIDMATSTGDGYAWSAVAVAMIALAATVVTALAGRGLLRLTPILAGIAVGYLAAIPFGFVDIAPVRDAAWLAVPSFTLPTFHLPAILFILPVALAPAIEHFGDVLAIRGVTGKDYLADPGVDRTMLGDGLATGLAGMLGGPPNTTYSEVTGAVALTRAFNPAVMTIAAVTAIVLAFVGKLGAFLQTIPGPVMGGILVLLFGGIVVVGINALVRAGTDLTAPRNLVIASVILVFGVGGMLFEVGDFRLEGIGLAGIVGVLLNAVLPRESPPAEPS
ncbi:MAG: uracil-xanthine permease family protein [Trueperaceae bacterium]|nr:uracil-xanthine permease family protein [Trueperaceae bacterium]